MAVRAACTFDSHLIVLVEDFSVGILLDLHSQP